MKTIINLFPSLHSLHPLHFLLFLHYIHYFHICQASPNQSSGFIFSANHPSANTIFSYYFLNSVFCSVQFCEGISCSTLFKTAFHSFILLFRRLALFLFSCLLPFSLIFYSILPSPLPFPHLLLYCLHFSSLFKSSILISSLLLYSLLFYSILLSSILQDF